ncbi:PEP/pyruvate-binding domain-containing protein [Actinoplanes derwentensis]|nr:PEP/pyruvate-binding domain-containing protein [Actinoplanes derwentensis]
MSLGLPVPPGFVITTEACRAFLRDGCLPECLEVELAEALSALESSVDRLPLLVSVRSGAAVSMPGMMNTFLQVGREGPTDPPPQPSANPPFTQDPAVPVGFPSLAPPTVGSSTATSPVRSSTAMAPPTVGSSPAGSRATGSTATGSLGMAKARDADGPSLGVQVRRAVEEVFASWNTPRAVTYRELHDVPHDLGTAVVVQAMVFGDRDSHSGSGVAFSRNPSTGEKSVHGDVLFGHQGEDVVSGRFPTHPLTDLAAREPSVWAALVEALALLERRFRDVCHVEFTYESGRLWFLQVRPGGLSGRAAVRATVELTDEGILDRRTALTRVTPQQLKAARTPRIRLDGALEVIARGVAASPGVATGRIAVTADQAARMAVTGPVILVRPHTSPLDMHGLAAAAGIVTTVGGPTSHAAVVARSLGKPSVVSATALKVDPTTGCVHTPTGLLREGTLITIDGLGGEVVLGSPPITAGDTDPHLARLLSWADEAITEGTT